VELIMSESIVVRVRRLVSGNVGDLMDAMENAANETVMREAIREVDRAMDDVRADLGRAKAKEHHVHRNISMVKAKLEELGQRAEFAVGQSRDDLAEAVIARQLDLEAQLPVLEAAAKEAAAEAEELDRCLAALVGRKHEMETDLANYRAAKKQASELSGSIPGTPTSNAERRSEAAHSAFNRAMTGASGMAAAPKTDRDTVAKLAELDRVHRQSKIHDRLEALKKAKAG